MPRTSDGFRRIAVWRAVLLGAVALDNTALGTAALAQEHAVALDQIHVEGSPGTTVSYLTTRMRTATKTDTPLLDTPQSVTVVTQQQIRDQGIQSIADAIRYVPGVVAHQGEGNRDDVVIRGQRSNADFFVNGIRDDAQYFRDLYNVQRIEVLKGPNAMIFGRGGGGGVINRVLKEADGVPLREVVALGGAYGTKRVAVDLGDRVGESDSVFFRLNAMFEDSGTYRDFVDLRRYGINPTLTVLLGPATTLKLSYEYFHDDRTADRGIPSQFGRPYRYRQNIATFFGNPDLSYARVDAHIATATLDHAFESGVTMQSKLRFADYAKFYQNVYPNIGRAGAVNAAGTALTLAAYNTDSPRTNSFSQTDFTYRFETGLLKHTLLGGFELGYQEGLTFRQDGFFATTGTQALVVNPLSPVSRVPVTFRNIASGADTRYDLGLAAIYAQDQIEIGPHLQLIGGLRYDHFDFAATDRRSTVTNARVDDLLSPRLGLVLKPVDTLAFYASYSISYLPSSGDQFNALTPGLAIAKPERFENTEVGVKVDVAPTLQLTGALYNLDRINQRLADPNNAGFFITSGQTSTQGAEIGANGFVTEWWQIAGGYAFTDARIVKGFNIGGTSVRAGNQVGLVPFNAFTLWNKFDVTRDFGIGIGFVHQTHSFAASDDTVRLPGYTRFDLGLFYQVTDGVRAQLNIENLFDRGYIATADGNNNISPGAPRLIRAQVVARF
ncbi:TonB-dependent receptor [Methylobacterium sp. Leaf113]|uniref:TonB-dependent receptor n=1 Tax=Methylobacterium sp. Leaf113 TaxID=1736259 RepID=UPI0006F37FDD|nr:TonB-dependent siderophore receptor [Methylobacterium sp. Leaf113]KQP92374.1 TonB-dependent receptor [Methylobacterium sp. Leaf113]